MTQVAGLSLLALNIGRGWLGWDRGLRDSDGGQWDGDVVILTWVRRNGRLVLLYITFTGEPEDSTIYDGTLVLHCYRTSPIEHPTIPARYVTATSPLHNHI